MVSRRGFSSPGLSQTIDFYAGPLDGLSLEVFPNQLRIPVRYDGRVIWSKIKHLSELPVEGDVLGHYERVNIARFRGTKVEKGAMYFWSQSRE